MVINLMFEKNVKVCSYLVLVSVIPVVHRCGKIFVYMYIGHEKQTSSFDMLISLFYSILDNHISSMSKTSTKT